MTFFAQVLGAILSAIGAILLAQLATQPRRTKLGPAASFLLKSRTAERTISALPEPVRRTSTKRNRLQVALELNRVGIPQRLYVHRVVSLGAVASLLVLTFELALSSSLLTAISAAVSIGAITVGAIFLLLHERATKIKQNLMASYPSLLERLSMLVGSGRSLTASLGQLSKDRPGPWTPWLVDIATHLEQGHRLADEFSSIADLLRESEIDRLREIVSIHALTSELPWLLANEMEIIVRRRRLQLTEILEKRSQLVWIPVSVAILIPGTLLLVIPLISALKFFGGV